MRRKYELLAPAGNFEKLQIAFHYGADAVYIGIPELSLRSQIKDMNSEVLKKSIDYTRQLNKKIYITINIYPHNKDLELIKEHLLILEKWKPDGIIFSDPGVFQLSKKYAPSIPLHISTQANITNYESAKFWESLGVDRIILAREVSIEEIKEFRRHLSTDLEAFVHGSICIAYSGRCFLSAYITNRSANKGECTNSCRWKYTLYEKNDSQYFLKEETRDNQYFPVYEDNRGTYIMSSKDLCMIEHLPLLADAGINSFKIEGRNKGINYLAGVVKTYREALDLLEKNEFGIKEHWYEELQMFSNRGFTTGMYFGKHPLDGFQHNGTSRNSVSCTLGGVVQGKDNNYLWITARDKMNVGDTIYFLKKGMENVKFKIEKIIIDNKESNIVKNSETAKIIFDKEIPESVEKLDILRKLL